MTKISGAKIMVGARLPPHEVERLNTCAAALNVSVSDFIREAIRQYVAKAAELTPVQPKGPPVKPTPTAPRPFGVHEVTPDELRRMGMTKDLRTLTSDEQVDVQHQAGWLRGNGLAEDMTPKARYDGDMAYLDYLEHRFSESGEPAKIRRVKRVRAHLLTLPPPPNPNV